MSTRCQVKVIQSSLRSRPDPLTESIMLYHHTDGYPTWMVPSMGEAVKAMVADAKKGMGDWQMGRAGKVASFLCAADPGVFEPEQGLALHGDIEWFYRLYVNDCIRSTTGHTPGKDRWELEILRPAVNFWKLDRCPTEKDLEVVHPRQPFRVLLKKFKLERAAELRERRKRFAASK